MMDAAATRSEVSGADVRTEVTLAMTLVLDGLFGRPPADGAMP